MAVVAVLAAGYSSTHSCIGTQQRLPPTARRPEPRSCPRWPGPARISPRANALVLGAEITPFDALVRQIAAASQEQSSGVARVNSAMSQMSSGTQQTASFSEELAATAAELAGQSTALQDLLQFFTLRSTAPRAVELAHA